MTRARSGSVEHGNAYNIFILVLTVMSLAIMALLLLPLSAGTLDLLTVYDNAICVIFLADFTRTMITAPSKRGYFIGDRGWLDLLGSIPSLQFFRFTALFRLARLSRLARISRLFRAQNQDEVVRDVVQHRAQYAAFITVLLAFVVLVTVSIVVLNAESRSADANITTGWQALWWSVVTLTTVGYGDFFPVTAVGRISAMFLMIMGIGIIGALASILASLLVGDSSSEEEGQSAAPTQAGSENELAAVRTELASLRVLVESIDDRLARAAAPTRGTDREQEPPA